MNRNQLEVKAGPARRSRAPLLLGTAFATLVAGIVWFTLFRGDPPQFQRQVDMPGMGSHLVNLWLRPLKDGSGAAILIGQVTDVAGMPVRVTSMEFELTRAERTTPESYLATYNPAALGRAHAFSASVKATKLYRAASKPVRSAAP